MGNNFDEAGVDGVLKVLSSGGKLYLNPFDFGIIKSHCERNNLNNLLEKIVCSPFVKKGDMIACRT